MGSRNCGIIVVTTLLPAVLVISTMSTPASVKPVAPRQPVSPWPLALPLQDQQLRSAGKQKGVVRFFSAWEMLATTDLAETKQERGEGGFTVFTVADTTWEEHLPKDVDPLKVDPILQRLVVATQLVLGPLDLSVPTTDKTVGGRTLVVTPQPGGLLTVNDVGAKVVAREGTNQLCVLDKLLFIRPEDIEIAVERARGAAV